MSAKASAQNQSIEELIEQLRQKAAGLEADDLTALAQMHGWCEAIAHSSDKSDPLLKSIKTVGAQLESLILGEADDVSRALTEIIREVSALGMDIIAPAPAPAAAAPPLEDIRSIPAAESFEPPLPESLEEDE